METYLGNIHKNIMGTTSFDLRIPGMRKNQNFIVYPIQKDDEVKIIKIQSDTRIGTIDLKNNKGSMSQSHSSGAYAPHLMFDKKTEFQLRNVDLEALRLFIFTTTSEKAGKSYVYCDNSNASNVI